MAVEIIRLVKCDRCGKDCSTVIENNLHEERIQDHEVYSHLKKQYLDNRYSYTEITATAHHSSFGESSYRFVLCGKCENELTDWLKIGGKDEL